MRNLVIVMGVVILLGVIFWLSSAAKSQETGQITGTVILRDSTSGGVSIVPYSLPGTTCRLNIVACDMGGNPPGYVGAGRIYSADETTYLASTSYSGTECGETVVYEGNGICGYRTLYCKESDDECSTVLSNKYCYDSYYTIYIGYCCDLDGEDNILGTDDDNVVSGGHCCPKDYPFYDSTTGKCVKIETQNTAMNRYGICSYASISSAEPSSYLFFSIDGTRSSSTADYVSLSYICTY